MGGKPMLLITEGPEIIFILFLFLVKDGVLRLGLKLDNLNISLYTHTHTVVLYMTSKNISNPEVLDPCLPRQQYCRHGLFLSPKLTPAWKTPH